MSLIEQIKGLVGCKPEERKDYKIGPVIRSNYPNCFETFDNPYWERYIIEHTAEMIKMRLCNDS